MSMKINGLYVDYIEPSITIGGAIEIFENVWSNPEQTIYDIESVCHDPESGITWQKAGTIGQGAYQNYRTNKALNLSYLSDINDNKIVQSIHNKFHATLLSTTNSYAQRFNINEPFFHEEYSMLKYSGGEEYKVHYDGGTSIGRCVSALCYLNSDFVGGEIEFVHFNVKVKPQPGMVILFPSNYAYAHVAHPVTEGAKYTLVTWIKDRSMQ